MYFRKGDPDRDFDRYDMALAQREAKLPVCDKCGKPINDDIYFDIDGEVLCEECLRDLYERNTEDWLNDHY